MNFSESFFERVVRSINVLQPVSLWSCFSRFFVHICVRNPLILLFSPNFSSGWNILQLLPPHFFSSLKHLAKLTFTFVTVNQCHVKVFCSIYSGGSLLQILFSFQSVGNHRNIVFYFSILNPDVNTIASEICFNFLPVYGAVHLCFFKGIWKLGRRLAVLPV